MKPNIPWIKTHVALGSLLSLFILFSFMLGCGGGTDTANLASTTISGTGDGGTEVATIAYGSIDQFGSVYVGGVHFATTNSTVALDGKSASVDDLELGMWVTVEGRKNSSSTEGVATSIRYESQLAGQIEEMEGANILTVQGVKVRYDELTHYSPSLFSSQLKKGLEIIVSGEFVSEDLLRAHFIGLNPEKKQLMRRPENLRPQMQKGKEVHLQAYVDAQVSSSLLLIAGYQVDVSEVKIKGSKTLPRAGDFVSLEGTSTTAFAIKAKEIWLLEDGALLATSATAQNTKVVDAVFEALAANGRWLSASGVRYTITAHSKVAPPPAGQIEPYPLRRIQDLKAGDKVQLWVRSNDDFTDLELEQIARIAPMRKMFP